MTSDTRENAERGGPPPQEVLAVAEQILEYLEEYPDACDTLLGIWSWWWSQRELKRTRCLVEAAVALLARQGVLSAMPA